MNILRSQSVTKYSRKALLYSLYSLESLKRESQKALLNNMLPRHRPAMRAESFMPPIIDLQCMQRALCSLIIGLQCVQRALYY